MEEVWEEDVGGEVVEEVGCGVFGEAEGAGEEGVGTEAEVGLAEGWGGEFEAEGFVGWGEELRGAREGEACEEDVGWDVEAGVSGDEDVVVVGSATGWEGGEEEDAGGEEEYVEGVGGFRWEWTWRWAGANGNLNGSSP